MKPYLLLASAFLAGPVLAGEPPPPPLAGTALYQSTVHGCHAVDLATWQHPTRKVMEKAHAKLTRVELCNDGKYPIYHTTFKADMMSSETDSYFTPLYMDMLKANGGWPMSLVDDPNGELVDIDVEPGPRKGILTQFEQFTPAK